MSVISVDFRSREKLPDLQATSAHNLSGPVDAPDFENLAPVVSIVPSVTHPPALEYVQHGVNFIARLLGEEIEIAGIIGGSYSMEPYTRDPGSYTVGGKGLRDFSDSLATIVGIGVVSSRNERNDVAKSAQVIYGVFGMRQVLPRIVEASKAGSAVFKKEVHDFASRHSHATFHDASRIVYGRTAAALALIGVAPYLRGDEAIKLQIKNAILLGKFPRQNPDVAKYFQHYTLLKTAIAMTGLSHK